MPGFLLYNGALLAADASFISPEDRGFKFGDGFFETMKVVNGQPVLAQFHFERLFASLHLLGFDSPAFFTPAWLLEQVQLLVQKNGHLQRARVRITIFRGSGGVYGAIDHLPHCIIQSWALTSATGLNEKGLCVDVFREGIKVSDHFSHIKSSNYLCYALAALWAGRRQLDDALVLNPWRRVADATVANVFIVHEGVVKTPPLEEGCINGVMRRYLLAAMRAEKIAVAEVPVTEEMLGEATELFLTNAISGIRWVEFAGKNTYTAHLSSRLYNQSINTHLW